MEYPTCHLYFLGIQTRLKACIYTEKIQETCGIFHTDSIQLKSMHRPFLCLEDALSVQRDNASCHCFSKDPLSARTNFNGQTFVYVVCLVMHLEI